MTDVNDLLVEIGTEELPPKALRALSDAFAAELVAELDGAGLAHGTATPYATPRRLAVLVPNVPGTQPDRNVERRGPPLARAFDGHGAPTKAALGFARSVGVELDTRRWQLEGSTSDAGGDEVDGLLRIETEHGKWLGYRSTQPGAALASLLPGMVERALTRLPVPRRMRWSDRDTEFVRPVHRVVLMHGPAVIEAEILGVSSGRATRGHRFHHPGDIGLEDAAGYEAALRDRGHVVARLEERMETIRAQVERAARNVGGRALIDPALLEENAALVEWPVAITGHFDPGFLDLPDAVLVATMQGHQRYFPVAGPDGALMPHFIGVSNIESRNPATVREGNERVIRPRLSDAAYFFRTDRARRLHSRLEALEAVVFQRKLGSLRAKSGRVAALAGRVARAMGGSGEAVAHAARSGRLSKCDLLTEMVGEFPELQGEMGREYARLDGEPDEVADALGEVYLPRFADDGIPDTAAGRAVAMADKLDTIVGCLSLGQAPTGDKDPFALRRAALGTLRIMIEGELDLDLDAMIEAAFEGYAESGGDDPGGTGRALRIGETVQAFVEASSDASSREARDGPAGATADAAAETSPDAAAVEISPAAVAAEASSGAVADVRRFMLDRLRAYFADRSIPTDVFNAVLATAPTRPLDFAMRVRAVEAFRALPEAESLAAANKRIRNILRQAEQGAIGVPGAVDDALLHADAERSLSGTLDGIEPRVRAMLDAGEYTGALAHLAGLRDDVDRFFDTVKVMDDDENLRGNRLALLARTGALFMETADISLLS
ncbi:MAG: glycine--tRNA ligase subunit beta [Thiotrichales bacterium]|nr:glycine--tRNA ligase subunit beta [Thiotrichales bacterium]